MVWWMVAIMSWWYDSDICFWFLFLHVRRQRCDCVCERSRRREQPELVAPELWLSSCVFIMGMISTYARLHALTDLTARTKRAHHRNHRRQPHTRTIHSPTQKMTTRPSETSRNTLAADRAHSESSDLDGRLGGRVGGVHRDGSRWTGEK